MNFKFYILAKNLHQYWQITFKSTTVSMEGLTSWESRLRAAETLLAKYPLPSRPRFFAEVQREAECKIPTEVLVEEADTDHPVIIIVQQFCDRCLLLPFTTPGNSARLGMLLRSPEVTRFIQDSTVFVPGLAPYLASDVESALTDTGVVPVPVPRRVRESFSLFPPPPAPTLPAGLYLRPLHSSHLSKVMSYWPARYPGTKEMLSTTVNAGLSCGLFSRGEAGDRGSGAVAASTDDWGADVPPPERLHAWAVVNRSGAVGLLTTEEGCRGRGYAAAVLASLGRTCCQRGMHPVVNTDVPAVIHILDKMGYQPNYTGVWLNE